MSKVNLIEVRPTIDKMGNFRDKKKMREKVIHFVVGNNYENLTHE